MNDIRKHYIKQELQRIWFHIKRIQLLLTAKSSNVTFGFSSFEPGDVLYVHGHAGCRPFEVLVVGTDEGGTIPVIVWPREEA